MRTFRIAMVQMNPTVGDLDGNVRISNHTIRTCILDGVRMASVVDYVMLVRGLKRHSASDFVRRVVVGEMEQSVHCKLCCFTKGGKRSLGVAAIDLIKLTFRIASGARVTSDIINKWATNINQLVRGDTTNIGELHENTQRFQTKEPVFDGGELAVLQNNVIIISNHTIRTCILDGVRMASVVDYVMLVRGLKRVVAATFVRRFVIGELDQCIRMVYCWFTKGGKKSLGVAATDLIKLTFKIASGARVASDIINKWALTIARVEGGDTSITDEIEVNAGLSKLFPDGPNAFMLDGALAEKRTKRDAEPVENVVVKKTRHVLGPSDVCFWLGKRFNKTADEAMALAKNNAILNNSEALASQVRAEEQERAASARAEEQERVARARAEEHERKEAAKRETMKLAHEQSLVAQTLISRLDSRFYQIRDLNEDTTEKAGQGACFYMVDCLNSTIMFGMTSNSLKIRYRNEKNRDVVLGNVLVAVQAKDKEEARAMEWTFKNLVSIHAPEIRLSNGREKIINSYKPFAKVLLKWNAWAIQQKCPVVMMP